MIEQFFKVMKLKLYPLVLLVILPLFNSCINNADFDQIDLDVKPIVNTPLVYIELDQLDFFDVENNTEIEFITDVTDIEVFQSSFIRDNLSRLDLNFNIQKDFPRTVTFFVDFLDVNDNVTFSFEPIGLNSGINNIQGTQILGTESNPAIFNTTKIRVTVRLTPGSSPLDPDVERFLRFRSIGIFYLRI